MASESKTAVVAAFVGNAALAILKGVTAAMTGSAAMLAETCHSLADTGNQILLFVGMRLSQRPPDRARPFGYGMNTYFWSFVVSAMLFTLGGAFSIWEAVHKFIRPAENAASPAAFFVLAGAFVFEAMSLGVALHSIASQRRGMPLLRFVRETRDPFPQTFRERWAVVRRVRFGADQSDRAGRIAFSDTLRRRVRRHRATPHRRGVVPGLRELFAPARRAGDRGARGSDPRAPGG